MTANEILDELKSYGNETTRRTWINHGAGESCFGVKIEHMKKIQKRIKVDHKLALELYDSGISDVMYFAGLIADDPKMTKKDLQRWVEKAKWGMVAQYTVPWVASGSPHGRELAMKWIDSKKELIALAGWATYSSMVSVKPDEELDLPEVKKLLERVEKTIHDAPNKVRYVMNGFVIAVGSYVKPLSDAASKVAKRIGVVSVDMPGDCKVPFAPDYIEKAKARGTLTKKRKMAKC